MNKKISDKDNKVWQDFISSKDKLPNKDINLSKNNINNKIIKTIDLHGFSLENANKTISEYIERCFFDNVKRLVVVTGKGLRSNTEKNPYVSKDLSILKHSVPEFIKSNLKLMKLIKEIKIAKEEEGGSGAFIIYLKNFKE